MGIYRVMWRGGQRRQRTIFYVLASALPEISAMLNGGTVYVTRHESGPLDNFASGDTVMILMDVKISEAWLSRPVPLEYSNDMVYVYMQSECLADWYLNGYFNLATTPYAIPRLDVGQDR
jgi:hypothetical protein